MFMSLMETTVKRFDVGVLCQNHRVEDDGTVELFDGTFVAYCTRCADRIELDRIPGGSLLVRAKSLLHVIKDGRGGEAHELEFRVLKTLLGEEIASLREVAHVLGSVEESLCQN